MRVLVKAFIIILFAFLWVSMMGMCVPILNYTPLLGIVLMILISFAIWLGGAFIYELCDDLFDAEEEQRKWKAQRVKAREPKPYYEDKDRIVVKVRFRDHQWDEEKPKPAPKVKKVKVKKKKLPADFALQEREYRGRNINNQQLG